MEQSNNVNSIGCIAPGTMALTTAGYCYTYPQTMVYAEFGITRALNGFVVKKYNCGEFVFNTKKQLCEWLMKELGE